MTLVLDTRDNSFGEMYTTSGPCSSKQLEARRRRFSWITPIFEGTTEENKKCIQGVNSKANMTLSSTSQFESNDSDITLTESKETNTVFESFRRGSFSKAMKFLKSLVKEPKSKSDNSSIIGADSQASTIDCKISGGMHSSKKNSLKLPKEVVEQVIREQSSMSNLKIEDGDKPSLRRSKPFSSEKNEEDSLVISPNISLDLSDISDISTHSVSVRNDEDKQNKTTGKSTSNQQPKKQRNNIIDKAGNRYIVNENGKIIPVQLDNITIKGILKNDKKETKFKKHTKSNNTSFSISNHCKNLLSKSKAKEFRFNEFVVIFETYSMEEYDRRMVMCLEQNLADTVNIKMELNDYKSKEMVVHPDSRKYTHFLTI